MLGRLSAVLGGVAALAGGATVGSFWESEPAARLIFLDVGQGDCSVITSGEQSFLIDAGPRTEEFDAGSRIVAPKLRKLGIDRIDLLFITHPDMDHVGGLPGLASKIRIDRVAAPAHFRGHAVLAQCLAEAGFRDRDVLWVDRPLAGSAGPLRFDLRLPTYSKDEPENEGSLLLRCAIGNSSAVFTGDANEEVEAVESGKFEWQADLLKAGHHGSATSTSKAWLAEVRPHTVVVSCGARNTYGHPAPSTLARIRECGAGLARTDTEGDLVFEPTPTGFRRVP